MGGAWVGGARGESRVEWGSALRCGVVRGQLIDSGWRVHSLGEGALQGVDQVERNV